MKTIFQRLGLFLSPILLTLCQTKPATDQLRVEVNAINLSRGDIALCGSEQFGQVEFSLACEEAVRADFNLATSLLHSFEYTEAEKVFAKVLDRDPECIMAYWGVAMSNFHPLWAQPTNEELVKGAQTIKVAKKLEAKSAREEQYLQAIATIFEDWETLDHKTRVQKFVTASEAIYSKYPQDKEAAIFYALALRASADPADKSFEKQKKAGEILSAIFPNEPNHPGVAHYLIHTYDYPELAELALPAARKYASIAATSAHAQHMPSHIFTRLGLWDESIQSNLNSTEAAKCYAEKLGKQGHWDQELHGLDYLIYAYLQQGQDDKAKEQVTYLRTIENVFPVTFVDAYTFAAAPMRYALERKDWKEAATLELYPTNFPWDKFLWQKGIHHFGKLLGTLHTGDKHGANAQLIELKNIYGVLVSNKQEYEANQVKIQITTGEAWMHFANGHKEDAVKSMIAAADMEDATEKHPVTPGEIAPARELLGDLYLACGDYAKAYEAYTANLKKRPNRFNSLHGAAFCAAKAGDRVNAKLFYQKLVDLTKGATMSRSALTEADLFLKTI
jgi:tetratricopeptide (TPR) repeat protein